MSEIVLIINKLIEYKEEVKRNDNIKNKIIKELVFLGYDLSHKGTKYLVDSIQYIILNPNQYNDNLEKDVYPVIAKRYNNSAKNIKANIIRANDVMYSECELERLKKYFKFDKDTKPKVKTVIYTVMNNIN